MSRLESVSPLVVSWAVALGFGGLLLILIMSNDPPQKPQEPPQNERQQNSSEQAVRKPVDVVEVGEGAEGAGPRRQGMPATNGQNPSNAGRGSVPLAVEPPDVSSKAKPGSTGTKNVGGATTKKNVTSLVGEKPQARPVTPTPPQTRRPDIPTAPEPTPPKTRTVREITQALAQPVSEFRQEKAVELRGLLREVAILAGVEFRFDPDLDEEVGLEQKVSLTIKATTVDQILVNLLARVRLTRDVREGHVWIRRKGSGDESP